MCQQKWALSPEGEYDTLDKLLDPKEESPHKLLVQSPVEGEQTLSFRFLEGIRSLFPDLPPDLAGLQEMPVRT
uniref:Uncharacterized protein n=1 Tax=Sphaerodactylus townsendi TaxID=933632 RepID=A0ACB8EWC4_9SAUR